MPAIVEDQVETSNADSAPANQLNLPLEGDGKTSAAKASTAATESSDKTKTLEEVVKNVFESHSSGEKNSAESDVRNSNKTQKGDSEQSSDGEKEVDSTEQNDDGSEQGKEESEQDQQEEKKDGTEEDKKGPIPYRRFEEVNRRRVEAEQRLEKLKPVEEAFQSFSSHCQKYGITEEQFNYWMDVAAMVNSDPARAKEVLRPILGKLDGFTGDALPSDLQTMVENNEIPLAVAKRLAAAEANQKLATQKRQVSEKNSEQVKQQQLVSEMTNSLNSWMGNKQTSDPDFKQKSSGQPDGKFELFLYQFRTAVEESKPSTTQELVKLADQVYTQLGSTLERFIPKPAKTKVVRSTNSASNGNGAPRSVEDVIAKRAAAHGIHFEAPKR